MFIRRPQNATAKAMGTSKNSRFIKQSKNFTSASRGLAIFSLSLFNYDLK